ncbi:hypothetical protein HanIR_Chr16g0808421 [Helianthus annuus]|nr:hypothetical protein HanIR_Chr16g0808421 [Helianthus annuus]
MGHTCVKGLSDQTQTEPTFPPIMYVHHDVKDPTTPLQTLRQSAAISSSFLHHHAHYLSSFSLPWQPEHITTPPSPIAGKPHISHHFVLRTC